VSPGREGSLRRRMTDRAVSFKPEIGIKAQRDSINRRQIFNYKRKPSTLALHRPRTQLRKREDGRERRMEEKEGPFKAVFPVRWHVVSVEERLNARPRRGNKTAAPRAISLSAQINSIGCLPSRTGTTG
jgi:hypothetical protein